MKNYIEQYKQIHAQTTWFGSGACIYIEELCLIIDFLKPKSVLDYGCGKGCLVYALKKLYPEISFYKYDPAIEEISVLPVKKVDLVINTDVLEHIPEEYLESVAKSEAFLNQKINPSKCISEQSEQIIKLSKEIVGNIKTDYEKARAISEWIVEYIKYDDYRKMNRNFSSVALEPEDVLARGCTVCEGFARLTKALLCAIHIPTLHMIGHLKGQESVWHAWNVSFVDGRWIWMDNANGIKNFDMLTKVFARTHILDGGVKVTVDNTVAVDKLTEIFAYEEC